MLKLFGKGKPAKGKGKLAAAKAKKKPRDADEDEDEGGGGGFLARLLGRGKKDKGAKKGKGAKKPARRELPEDDDDFNLDDEESSFDDFDDDLPPPPPPKKGGRAAPKGKNLDFDDDPMMEGGEFAFPWELGFPSAEKTIKAGKNLGMVLKLAGLVCLLLGVYNIAMMPVLDKIPAQLPMVLGGLVALVAGILVESAVMMFVLGALASVRTEEAVLRLEKNMTQGVKDMLEKMPVQEVAIEDVNFDDLER